MIACLVLLFAYWVLQTPSQSSSASIDSVFKEVEARFSERQNYAKNRELNGYLDPHFSRYWGRESFEHEAESDLEKTVVLFRDDSSSIARGKVVNHTARQSGREDFEALLPPLKAALEKPYFVVPEAELSSKSEGPNSEAFIALTMALSGHCEILQSEGKTEESLESFRLIFELGDKLVELENEEATMTGAMIYSLGLQTFNGVYSPDAKLNSTQWKDLANFLLSKGPEETITARNCAARNYYLIVKELRSAESQAYIPLVARYIPGFLAREERITRRTFFDAYMNIGLKHTMYPRDLKPLEFLWGEVGFQASQVCQDVFQIPKELQVIETRLLGYGICCGLLAYRAENGHFPESIEALADYGIDLPSQLYSPKYQVSDGRAELSLWLYDTSNSSLLNQGPFYGNGVGWARLKDGRLYFQL